MKFILAKDASGQYRRDLGFKPTPTGDYRQHRFLLGRDRAQALIRSLALEKVWETVCVSWSRNRIGPRPAWDADTLAIAQAVSKGEKRVVLNHREGTEGLPIPADTVVAWLYQMRQDFPEVQIDLEDTEVQQRGAERLEQAAKGNERDINFIRQVSCAQTLHEALEAFALWIATSKRDAGTDRVSQTGVLWQRQVRQIREHTPDVPLSSLDLNRIEGLINYWKNRPLSKRTGRPMARETVRDVIKRIRTFVKWLHRNPSFKWRKPEDLELGHIRIPKTHAELAARVNTTQVATYSVEELSTLYEYATPYERASFLLALNCGFGIAEATSLQLTEIHLDSPHKHYKVAGSWIYRIRFKSGVYGEWQLWPETVAAIRWLLSRRPQTSATELLTTRTGRSLQAPTSGNNRPQAIANAWAGLWKRICKDNPNFRKLSFNKLRKTSSDMIRKIAGGEVAGMFLCHGETTGDELLDVYTNRNYAEVFSAQEKMREKLAGMFARVSEPFPVDYIRSNPALSLGKIKKIQDMIRAGFKVRKIAEEVECTEETVRFYAKRMKDKG